MTYIDSNIFIYAIDGNRVYGEACTRILSRIKEGSLEVGVSCLVLMEIMGVLRKINVARSQQGNRLIDIPLSIDALLTLPIVWFDMSAFIVQRAVHTAGRLFPADAIHASTAEGQGIREIISADKDFDRSTGLVRIDPLDWKE